MKRAPSVALALAMAACGSSDNPVEPDADTTPTVSLLPLVATTAPCFQSPQGEGVTRLVDHSPNTKFLGSSSSIWAELAADQLYVLDHYAMTSANDIADRDPHSWLLQGSSDRVNWVTLDTRTNEVFATRWERREFTVAGALPFRFYRLRAENTLTGTTQLAELELFGRTGYAPRASAPMPPVGLTASATYRSKVELHWQPGSDAEYYRIERSLGGAAFDAVAYVPGDAGTTTLAGLPADTEVALRIVAENGAGSSAPSETATAHTLPPLPGSSNPDGSVSYSQGDYSLTIHNKDVATPAVMITRILDEYFAVYPTMAAAYNTSAPKAIRVTFDPMYSGVAYASGPQITISSTYAQNAPDDIDVIVHEGFHVVQAYSNPNAPGWAVEGLADFVRGRYGTQNSGACWAMKRYEPSQSYTNAYGVTARFLLWIEDTVRPTITTELDAALRDKTYTDAFWSAKTGKTVDELWTAYGADSARRPVDYR